MQVDIETAEPSILEIRALIERQEELARRLAAAGLNAADIQASLKALSAQLELLERRVGAERPPALRRRS